MDKKRTLVQTVFTVITNGYIKGFLTGTIYSGATKSICVPGLSCYSCPGALFSCPIGAYQAVVGERNIGVSFYIIGLLTVVGGVCGRFICGWLCPFGLFQDLLCKIPTRLKIAEPAGDVYLKYLRYFVLGGLVLIPTWFCKYLCPSGTLMAGLPLLIADESLRAVLGALFVWKAFLLTALIVTAIVVYRPFCRYICPLGAVYGLFNKISLYRYSFDKNKCEGCGACSKACRMNIKANEKVNCADCIRCGNCVKSCTNGALQGK